MILGYDLCFSFGMFWLGKLGMLEKSGDMIYVFVLVYLEHVGYIN